MDVSFRLRDPQAGETLELLRTGATNDSIRVTIDGSKAKLIVSMPVDWTPPRSPQIEFFFKSQYRELPPLVVPILMTRKAPPVVVRPSSKTFFRRPTSAERHIRFTLISTEDQRIELSSVSQTNDAGLPKTNVKFHDMREQSNGQSISVTIDVDDGEPHSTVVYEFHFDDTKPPAKVKVFYAYD